MSTEAASAMHDNINNNNQTIDIGPKYWYTLKTEVLKITLQASFLTHLKSARRDNTRSVTLTPREV